MLSANTTLVLGLNAFASSASSASGFTRVHSTPILGKVTVNRLVEPPYMVEELITWSPAWQIFNIA